MAADTQERKQTIIKGGTVPISRALSTELVARGHEVIVLNGEQDDRWI